MRSIDHEVSNGHDYASLLYSFAIAEVKDVEFVKRFIAAVQRKVHLMEPRDISQIAWSLGKLKAYAPVFFDIVAQSQVNNVDRFKGLDVA